MNKKSIIKGFSIGLAAYLLFAIVFFIISGDRIRHVDTVTDSVINEQPTGEIVAGLELRQGFKADADELRAVSILLSTYARENSGTLRVAVFDESGELGFVEIPASEIADNTLCRIEFTSPIELDSGRIYELVLSSEDSMLGNAVTAWYGSAVPAAKTNISIAISEWEQLRIGDILIDGKLCYSLELRDNLRFGQLYPYIVIVGGLLIAGYAIYSANGLEKSRVSLVIKLVAACERYNYLLRQLVSRDFKTKYKRSVLGVLWSFLNPTLTMLVQYMVFSTLFKSDIPNFALYLLIGIVCFNFFSEATSMSLISIVGNASLITKVYVPKYIYPLSRVMSSTVNLLLSLIPLAIVMAITGAKPALSIVMLPFALICLMLLCLGIGFVLSTAMVFFRDTQFLWGIVSMLWMYVTPIFYPESIIPAQYMGAYRLNPLYHIIGFIRTIMIDGVSPEPAAYLFCILSAVIPLAIGAIVFKKNQDKFAINL